MKRADRIRESAFAVCHALRGQGVCVTFDKARDAVMGQLFLQGEPVEWLAVRYGAVQALMGGDDVLREQHAQFMRRMVRPMLPGIGDGLSYRGR